MSDDRRLIEDFLPIQAISAEASREKSVRKGHISTLHLWWARRPLVACRAAVYGTLVPASRFVPENGPDNKKQSLGRANAAKFIERLCKYPGNPAVIKEAQKHILEAHAERLSQETGKPVTVEDIEEGRAPRPKVLDMFAGGGAIPLEALRLGCEAYALDLNPVAHIIQLCTLVYRQKYGKPDPNSRGMTGRPQAGSLSHKTTWGGLASGVRYWGEWVLKKAKCEIGDLYPLIPDPEYEEKRGRTGVPPVILQNHLFQTRRHLPHWQIGGSVYFITFSTRKEGEESRLHLTERARQIVLDSLLYWNGTKVKVHLACVMPDHVHALIEPLEETPGKYYDLSKILHSIKSFSANEINKLLGRSGSLWEEESWDRIVRDEQDYQEKWQYILNNPIKEELCDKPEDYKFLWFGTDIGFDRFDRFDRPEACPPPCPPSNFPSNISSHSSSYSPSYLVPVAYLWTRTVRCKNPSCGATVPLVRQTWLCKKKDRYVALRMIAKEGGQSSRLSKQVRFEVVEAVGQAARLSPEKALGFDPAGFSKGGNATCPFCGTVADSDYVKAEGCAKRMGQQLMAVVCTRPGKKGKVYLSGEQASSLLESTGKMPVLPEEEMQRRIEELCRRTGLTVPREPMPKPGTLGFRVQPYGVRTWGDLFTARQMLCLLSFAAAVRECVGELERKGVDSEQVKAVATYLACALDKVAEIGNILGRWEPVAQCTRTVFGRQALPMVWDFGETVPTATSAGNWNEHLGRVIDSIGLTVESGHPAIVTRGSAMALPWPNGSFDAVVTDPPYYDNVSYSNLSDFFYVWLKRTVGHLYPEHFTTEGTPKKSEVIAAFYRHGGDKHKSRQFYEQMMAQAFTEGNRVLKPGSQMVVVYAHKTTLGWSTLVDALRRAGFTVTEVWPLDTEMKSRLITMETASLASSIFLVARKREGAGTGSYEDEVRPELDRIVRERVDSLWKMGITGADLVIAAVGAGLRA